MLSTIEVGKRYTFEVYGGSILTNKFSNVKILSILNGRTAEKLGYNVSTMHAQVYPYLPTTSAVKQDYLSQDYYEVETETGTLALGEYWIKEDTINLLTSTQVTIVLSNVTPEKLAYLPAVLAAHGISVTSVTKNEIEQ